LKWVRIKVDKHLLPFFAGKRAHLITTSALRAFVIRRQKQGASNAAINREIAALKRALNLGLQSGTISRKPQFIRLSENNVRRGFFERREFEALLANFPDYLRAPVTFAYLTGWRLQIEILTLTWDRVNLDEGSIRLPKGSTKNREGRVIFLEGELGGLVTRQWTEHLTLFRIAISFFIVGAHQSESFGLLGRMLAALRNCLARYLTTSVGQRCATWSAATFPREWRWRSVDTEQRV
jgi:integrase